MSLWHYFEGVASNFYCSTTNKKRRTAASKVRDQLSICHLDDTYALYKPTTLDRYKGVKAKDVQVESKLLEDLTFGGVMSLYEIIKCPELSSSRSVGPQIEIRRRRQKIYRDTVGYFNSPTLHSCTHA